MEFKEAIAHLFTLLYLILLLRIALSWFPRVDWYKQPFKFINDVAEPILAPFKVGGQAVLGRQQWAPTPWQP